VKIGKQVVIAAYVIIDPYFPELITIEDNVIIGVGATILTNEYSQHGLRKAPVHIKKRALIGGNSLIRSGVPIGEHAVIAAQSIVNKDIPDHITVGGIPAKKLQQNEMSLSTKT
jgi:acetyltransferase-like isoleucine patch superfamily enzyme